MTFAWPESFHRIPCDPWVGKPVESLAINYDSVENHGWYSNLDYTVEQIDEFVRGGEILIDYSGGTGILTQRLLDRFGSKEAGIIIVDSSPKFLRLSLEKFRNDQRVAFRNIRFLRAEKRLERVDEVLGEGFLQRGVDAVISTNAIHLYFDLENTLKAWCSVLRPGGGVFIQSGNIGYPELPADEWIIDETVEVIHRRAMEIVRTDDTFRVYRPSLDDTEYISAHDDLRRKYFLPVRPLKYYLDTLDSAGFKITEVTHRRIPANVSEWYDFLNVYHEGILGWVGGAEKITGVPASEEVINDRLMLMRLAMEKLFRGAAEFGASWTYVSGRKNENIV